MTAVPLDSAPPPPPHRPRVALVYDVFDAFAWRDGDPDDADAEYEPWVTVEAIEAGLRAAGAEPGRVGTVADLLAALPTLRADAAFSIAEGRDGINREGHAPTLFELYGLPFMGADALTMSLSLDKAWTNAVVAAAGVAVPMSVAVGSVEALDAAVATGAVPPFPVFVKPRFEGSAKGITPESRCETPEELRRAVARVTTQYGQDALVEAFIAGSEFTVAVAGHDPPRALPAIQRAVDAATGIGSHALDTRGSRGRGAPDADARPHDLPGILTPELDERLRSLALTAFDALRCRDFARMDFRVTPSGEAVFLEVNPLPTFAPDGTFAILAELAGEPYDAFLGRLFADALRRIGVV